MHTSQCFWRKWQCFWMIAEEEEEKCTLTDFPMVCFGQTVTSKRPELPSRKLMLCRRYNGMATMLGKKCNRQHHHESFCSLQQSELTRICKKLIWFLDCNAQSTVKAKWQDCLPASPHSHLRHGWLCHSLKNWQVEVVFCSCTKGLGTGTGCVITTYSRDVTRQDCSKSCLYLVVTGFKHAVSQTVSRQDNKTP